MEMHQSFLLNSWEDLHHVYCGSLYAAFSFRHCQRFFCRPVPSSRSNFAKYPRPVTFHPMRWLRLWPHCPGSDTLSLDSNLLLCDFQVAQLSKFIHRSEGPKITLLRCADVTFLSDMVAFTTYRHPNNPYPDQGPAL